jgi:hypothetical protein
MSLVEQTDDRLLEEPIMKFSFFTSLALLFLLSSVAARAIEPRPQETPQEITKTPATYPIPKLLVKQVAQGKPKGEIKVLLANDGKGSPAATFVEVALVGYSGAKSVGELYCGYFTGEYAGCHRTEKITAVILPGKEEWVKVKFWEIPSDIAQKNDWKKLTEYGYRVTVKYHYKLRPSTQERPLEGKHSLYVKHPLSEK